MDNSTYFCIIFYLFLSIKTLVQLVLLSRNRSYVLKNKNVVPSKFTEKISLEEHQKAAEYTSAQMQTSGIFLLYHLAILLVWTAGGMLSKLNLWSLGLGYSEMTAGLILICSFSFIETLLDIPESLYKTFVLEEKFGFNKTNAKTFITDFIKQIILSLLLGVPIIYGLLWIIYKLESNWWPVAWVFLSSLQLLMMWLYPRFIAPLFNKFLPLEDEQLKTKIFSLLNKVDFACQGIFVMDASKRSGHGNAYFTGLGKNKRIVFFDTLIKGLTPDQIEAVLAHELGHFKLKHIQKMLFVSLLFSFVGLYLLGYLTRSPWFYESFGLKNANYSTVILMFTMVMPVFTFFLTPLFSALSRKHEFEADHFASKYSSAGELISALVQMYKENASTLTPDPWFSRIYHSHPPAMERIYFLEKLISTQEKMS